MNSTVRRTGAILAAAGLVFGLASCSGGQSVAEACKVANSTVNDATSKMQGLMSDAMSGKGDMSTMFDPINAALKEAQGKVTNEEVSTALKKVSDEFSALSATMKDFKMPDMSSIDPTDPEAMAKLDEMQTQAQELSTKVQGQADSLTKAGQNLQKTCNAG
ncbi:hypothetical protein [Leucobacter sp. wl10]|uniref:hypothetical protein n=1 Tax=Leucobacter sp. wl10 TaxID=2304677 RepID=UPI000E5B4F38|nr:hypothetical protein [Leucobacter sp. wl10]RGE24360.1 hypothetical protein D1J51_01080 [Leucobacter sp. wl10]